MWLLFLVLNEDERNIHMNWIEISFFFKFFDRKFTNSNQLINSIKIIDRNSTSVIKKMTWNH